MAETITIKQVDHIGIRVAVDRAMAFYEVLGFEFEYQSDHDAVVIIKNGSGVEINLIFNANDANDGKNVLMDVPSKYAGYTHVALGVDSITKTMDVLAANDIRITQGPVIMREGHVAVFVRDPDRNVLELRGKLSDLDDPESITGYTPEN
jgi:catechol 2,3-dioxygenase-like lactoylglutathione lyase family enzyme